MVGAGVVFIKIPERRLPIVAEVFSLLVVGDTPNEGWPVFSALGITQATLETAAATDKAISLYSWPHLLETLRARLLAVLAFLVGAAFGYPRVVTVGPGEGLAITRETEFEC